jgi:hypothetical protein
MTPANLERVMIQRWVRREWPLSQPRRGLDRPCLKAIRLVIENRAFVDLPAPSDLVSGVVVRNEW